MSHVAHRCELTSVSAIGSRVLVHNIGEVDPLITATVTILSWVGLGAWDWLTAGTTHSRRIVGGPHEHRWFAMSRARRLRSDHACSTMAWGCITYSRLLNQMDLSTSCSWALITLLQVAQKTLHFLMSAGCWHISQLGTVDMLNVRQLPNGLIDNTLRIVRRLRDTTLALTMRDLAWRASITWTPGRTRRGLLVFLEVEACCGCVFLRLACDDSLITTFGVGQMPLLW